MRLDAGTVVEDLLVDDVGEVSVAYTRADGAWTAELTVRVTGSDDLAVVHRLHAPSLAAARRAVPSAAAFLAGNPVVPEYPFL